MSEQTGPSRRTGREVAVAAALGLAALVGTGAAVSHTRTGQQEPLILSEVSVAATSPATGSSPQASAVPASVATSAEPASHPVESPGQPVPRAAEAWVGSVSSATGIPAPAVRAYGDATLRLADERPACRLGWTTLAGIGNVESGHGTHGGATLADDGRPSIPIVGPALDGSPGRAAIRSTPQSVAWHGDPLWDHAVGPMQFIPSTWERWAADGDGDGVSDPQDIDDAALAAARYLCVGGADMSTGDGWWAAVRSYNHSDDYAAAVLAGANRYAAATSG